jgi:hypothetical protein
MMMSIVTGSAADNRILQMLSSNPSLPTCHGAPLWTPLFGRNIMLGGNMAGDLTLMWSRDWTPRSPRLPLIARACCRLAHRRRPGARLKLLFDCSGDCWYHCWFFGGCNLCA